MIWLATVGFAAVLVAAASVRCRLRIATVTGPSMTPAFQDHDRVLVRRAPASRLRRDDVVLVKLPTKAGTAWILKRVAALSGDPTPAGLGGSHVPPGMLVLLGDNPSWSVDSRDFGYVPVRRVYGVVVRVL
jgi:signal peptidase I